VRPVRIGNTVFALVNYKFPQMVIEPAHGSLGHRVQGVEVYLRIPGKATTLSGAWRPRDPVDDDWGGARA